MTVTGDDRYVDAWRSFDDLTQDELVRLAFLRSTCRPSAELMAELEAYGAGFVTRGHVSCDDTRSSEQHVIALPLLAWVRRYHRPDIYG